MVFRGNKAPVEGQDVRLLRISLIGIRPDRSHPVYRSGEEVILLGDRISECHRHGVVTGRDSPIGLWVDGSAGGGLN